MRVIRVMRITIMLIMRVIWLWGLYDCRSPVSSEQK
jgi:hypothetical protein